MSPTSTHVPFHRPPVSQNLPPYINHPEPRALKHVFSICFLIPHVKRGFWGRRLYAESLLDSFLENTKTQYKRLIGLQPSTPILKHPKPTKPPNPQPVLKHEGSKYLIIKCLPKIRIIITVTQIPSTQLLGTWTLKEIAQIKEPVFGVCFRPGLWDSLDLWLQFAWGLGFRV